MVFDVQFGEKGWDFVYGLCENEITNPEISDQHYTFIRSIMYNMINGRYWDWTLDGEDTDAQELMDFIDKYPSRT